jgi:transcriptional regulator with GAF, ATPase, and Fis domain
VARTQWLKWSELPWLRRADTGGAFAVCEGMLRETLETDDADRFLARTLGEMASHFSTQWAALLRRDPGWETVAQSGRSALAELPRRQLEEALDNEAAGFFPLDEPEGWSLIVVPVDRSGTVEILVLAGRHVDAEGLPAACVLGRMLGYGLDVVSTRLRREHRIERLKTTLAISRQMATVHETDALLDLIAREATRLLECDRASIFVHDEKRSEVIARPALGMEGGTLRLPDVVGLVGEVLRTGERIVVDDAYADDRFSQKVDQQSGYRTRTILCEPMRDEEGRVIGVFQVINKSGGTFEEEDQLSLGYLAEQASIAIRNTKEREQIVRSRDQLAEEAASGVRIIGESESITALRATIDRVAHTDLPVLVLGESGTGKEVVSRALHCRGPRADRPFIAVNCAALTESLLESELFGHEAGAFTDAREMRPGKFELADGGTLFLDEIGDMSPGGQAKLLRVLEEKVITRVGGSATIPTDVRVIAATNANLAGAVQDKKFRKDLYYRLSVVTLDLPPLRERPEDVLPLAEHFLVGFCQQAKRKPLRLMADARRRLQAHHWPGNVRELRNLMERVAFLTTEETVQADDLAFILAPEAESSYEPAEGFGLGDATKEFQREFIRRAIKRVGGNMSSAADLLGLHRSNLYRKMRQLEMETGEE